MTLYRVTPWLNADRAGMLDGYDGAHALTTAPDLKLRVSAVSPMLAAEAAFAVGNRANADYDGLLWPADVRSLSVGDLLAVQSGDGVTFLAVARAGTRCRSRPTRACRSPAATA